MLQGITNILIYYHVAKTNSLYKVYLEHAITLSHYLNINNSMYHFVHIENFTIFVSIKTNAIMLIVSSREFRDNQKKYFDSVDNGEQVIVQRGKDRSYKLVPVTSSDVCMTEEEFYEKIDRSIQQAKEGKVLRVSTNDDLKKLLDL